MMESSQTQTNWSIASGSLRNCVTFESSLSSFDDDASEQQQQQQQPPSTPLVLLSPSPDSGPCEIKITFAAKHELRQIYVRSTARVYEIYTAPALQSNNDYLCTVRCGVAARDGEVLRAPGIQEIASSHVEGSNRELCGENIKNEDDWVEVKVPDSPVLDERNIPLQTNSYTKSTESSQDLFEATAEINDVNPCISVTLRLLSLQSKGCIYVDEIYVFGDPVDSADSESQESRHENSSSSSLMAMFLPTLMQLSKTSGLGHLNPVKKEKQSFSAGDLEETNRIDSVNKTQLKGKASITDPQEVKLKEVNGRSVAPSQLYTFSQVSKMDRDHTVVSSQADTVESTHIVLPSQAAKMDRDYTAVPSQADTVESTRSVVPSQAAKMDSNHGAVPSQVGPTESNHVDSLGGNVERALEQIVSRMDRLEQICLGFQEKMLMPMSSIEARLQRVEQQLDTLTKKLQNSGPSYCGVSAPDASCIESDAVGYTVTRESEPDKKDLHTQVLSVSPDDISDSAITTQLLPGLVVTAPEFPDGEDEEDNASVQEMNSSFVEVKRSIDDALSSALANLLSTMSLESPKYTKSLSVKAPEFSSEDDDDQESYNEMEKNDSVHPTNSEKIIHIQALTSSNISLESGEELDGDSKDKETGEETAQESEECGQFCSVEGDQEDVSVTTSIVAEHNSRAGFGNNFEDDQNGKINVQRSDGLSSNGSDISNELFDNQTASSSGIAQEGPSARTDDTVATEVSKKTSREDIIENVLGFSLASSVVDFETPLLDVKFISQRSPVTDPLLEALLVGMPETNSQDAAVKESSDDLPRKEQEKNNGVLSIEEQSNLVSVDEGEPVNPAGDSHVAVEKDYSSLKTVPVNTESDNLPEDHKRKHDQIAASSLI